MLVILLKDVKNIGKKNDSVEVADGFAINFLLPRKLAKSATKQALSELGTNREQETKRAEADLKKTQELASTLDGLEIVIPGKVADPGGKLFAAISPKILGETLMQQGYDVKPSMFSFEPIKQAGEYNFVVSLAHGLEAQIKVIIEEKIEDDIMRNI